MCVTRTFAACFLAGAFTGLTPTWSYAQSTLPAATKVEPGSPQAGFAPTAYAETLADFHRDVRELDAIHVKLAEVAERSASPGVQGFAKQVRLEFSGGPSSLKGASDDQGVPIFGTVSLTREHQTLIDQLKASGADVDRLFVDYEVLVLKDSLGLVEAYATGGTEARLRQAAAEAATGQSVLLATARALQKQ